jgi:subtilisin family serine protease
LPAQSKRDRRQGRSDTISEGVIMRIRVLLILFFFCFCGCSGGSSSKAPEGPVDDPLFPYQWHISNTGQNAFSRSEGVKGEDLRMTQALAAGLSGQGVIIAILDDSLEIAHEDLKSNVIPGGSYNYLTGTTDPTSSMNKGEHGTSVAGIAAAVAMNGKGGRGVAPQAFLKGFNVLEAQTGQNYIDSMGGHDRSKDVHIFNMSYGDDGLTYNPLGESARELYGSTAALRGGKGGIYVKSAGNGFHSASKQYVCARESYGRGDLTCHNAAADEESGRPEVITVGAFNARGVKSSYSTAGSNLWVSAPGGEYGTDSPAIITPDQSGCDKGYSRSRDLYIDPDSPANDFDTGETGNDGKYNPGCNYTSGFNGTSSAAPNASGAIALMLQTNPNLTRRDVKHILAKTARKIDPESKPSIVTVDINGVNYQASEGWIKNKADYNFHNWYGFGAVHVDDAVAMAKTYNITLPALQIKSYGGALSSAAEIPDNDAAGLTQTITVPEADDLTIENLFVQISIDHPNTAETGIEITSPGGTRSILLNIRSAVKTGLNPLGGGGVSFASNAFYGEKSKGTWTLKILDSLLEKTGTLKHFGLRILGY